MKLALLTIALTVMTVSAQDAVTNGIPADATEAALGEKAAATNLTEAIPVPADTAAMDSTPEDIHAQDIHRAEDIHAADIHADDIHRAEDIHAPDIHAAEPGEPSANPRLPGK